MIQSSLTEGFRAESKWLERNANGNRHILEALREMLGEWEMIARGHVERTGRTGMYNVRCGPAGGSCLIRDYGDQGAVCRVRRRHSALAGRPY